MRLNIKLNKYTTTRVHLLILVLSETWKENLIPSRNSISLIYTPNFIASLEPSLFRKAFDCARSRGDALKCVFQLHLAYPPWKIGSPYFGFFFSFFSLLFLVMRNQCRGANAKSPYKLCQYIFLRYTSFDKYHRKSSVWFFAPH